MKAMQIIVEVFSKFDLAQNSQQVMEHAQDYSKKIFLMKTDHGANGPPALQILMKVGADFLCYCDDIMKNKDPSSNWLMDMVNDVARGHIPMPEDLFDKKLGGAKPLEVDPDFESPDAAAPFEIQPVVVVQEPYDFEQQV
jgi:hypothetical protein